MSTQAATFAYVGNADSGDISVFELRSDGSLAPVDTTPVTNCAIGFGAGGFSQRISYLQPTLGYFSMAQVAMVGATRFDVCFTPRGRTFSRNLPTDPFLPMLAVSEVTVTNSKTGVLRRVFMPPNGVARLLL